MKTFTLGELAVMKYGKLPPKEILDAGCPIFTGYRVSGYAKDCLYENSMLVVVARGVGGTGDVKLSPPRSWITNLSIVLDLDETKADKQFLCYFLGQQSLKDKLNTGSAQAQITVNALSTFQVAIPSLWLQRRIASILSAYDDLIENNTRRIEILEEMARRIYEEWFVRFRFPGHEGVRMVESEFGLIPEEWHCETLADCAFVTMGQSPSSEFYNEAANGLPFHQGVTNFGQHFPTNKLFCSVEGRLAEEGDILVSVRAPVGRVNLSPCRMVIGRGLCAIRSRTGQQVFLLHRLFETFKEEDSMGNGAIFKAVSKQEVLSLPFLVPEKSLIVKFEAIVGPLWSMIRNLTVKSTNLSATRDLLLPRLISGELDVSSLPEPEAVAA